MITDGIHFLDARGPTGMHVAAIGDVHGRLDLLEKLHAMIDADRVRSSATDFRVIHLGDFVDRGPSSKGVIDFLIQKSASDPRYICVAGNHDAAFQEFLARPDPEGVFALYGGRQTALSYGVEIDFDSPWGLRRGHAALCKVVPLSHMEFLRTLPRHITLEDFFFCHAGIRPGVPLAEQDPEDLIWIREAFLNFPGLHPKIVVHGHTPAGEAEVMANRVNVDTGAYKSGRLTALIIDGAVKRVVSVSG
ncbi:serine/threonine protein phosphatase [Mesorhizobium sp. NBSH29]|uniref:metallophosphoesterase n=1 Tax=Mesorhizobium sp. NBSH29 TaxID=2654249 RepID=UPI00189659F9|nr:metallophosphoesterase [Mesorhizobium sp. NBSH29]QPC86827.1 serine/threonine protein phosphatase [Mesorhizobium sp. NBSH29]